MMRTRLSVYMNCALDRKIWSTYFVWTACEYAYKDQLLCDTVT